VKPVRPALLGAFAAAFLAAAAGAGWFFFWPTAETDQASEILPLPPEPPRLADGPEYDRCLAMLRQDPQGAQAFAEAWEATGGGEGARHCAALALLGIGEPERAAERLQQIAQRSNGSAPARAAVLAQASQAWMIAGDAARAFAASTLALSLTPEDVDILVDRSIALGTLGRYREALDDLDRALAIDAERVEAWVFRAAALRHLDRAVEAEQAVTRALTLDPDNAEGLLERGIIRQLRGDVLGAKADWERAIALAPDTPTADLAQQNLALNEAGPQRR
jgi:tetratricopeptide (TPR) repeat protein